MKQQTLAGLEKYSKTTRRARFLAEMDRVVPWAELCALIEPHYPKVNAEGGRPPIPLERMLRIYFLQQWFNLSDPAVEDALYDSAAMREFVGIDLGREAAPDETTVCKFRHLLEQHEMGRKLFERLHVHLVPGAPRRSRDPGRTRRRSTCCRPAAVRDSTDQDCPCRNKSDSLRDHTRQSPTHCRRRSSTLPTATWIRRDPFRARSRRTA